MATAHGFSNIEKLSEQNYDLWKVQMKSVLIINDLWSYVDGTEQRPAQENGDWIKKDGKALALITLSITHSQLNRVKRATSSKEAWDGLKSIYESRGPVRKAVLYKQLLRLEKRPSESITQYVTDFTHKAEQLEEAGIKIPDELLSIMLLGSLPAEFENFCIAIESRDDIPSLDNLKIKLIEEEARQGDKCMKTSEDKNKNDALLTKRHNVGHTKQFNHNSNLKENNVERNTRKFNFKCFNCGKIGLKSRFCRDKFNRVESNMSDAMIAVACNTDYEEKSEVWFLDSGATRHMCNSEQKFSYINESNQSKVYTASKHVVESPGVGDVNLTTKINSHTVNSVKLEDTLFVPELRNNLLSVSSVTENGYTVTFNKEQAVIKRQDGSIAVTATTRNQLYIVDEKEDALAFVSEDNNKELQKWHQRFGHLNIHDLKTMKDKEIVSGLKFTSKVSEINCEICAKCKINVLPFKPTTNRENELLGLVHSDICGPIDIESLGGAKYFVTFIDDCSRYTETVMLRRRSDVLQAFKDYKHRVEKQTGKKIKKLRTDNGLEYLSKEFNNFLKDEGISRQLTVEYTPQQNGVAERANRTLVEMARCLMLQAKLPNSLWAEMINTATFLRNRTVTKSLHGITPFEAWTQRKPYVGYFRTIGSKTIALNKSQRKGKFQPIGEEYLLVGYSNESKAYRLWKPKTNKVIKSRDVKFFETFEAPETLTDVAPTVPMFTVENLEVEKSHEEILNEEEENFYEEIQDESEVNFDQENIQNNGEVAGQSNRAPGRPTFEKTGKAGRPKKIYKTKSCEPRFPSDVLERDDSEL